MSHDTRDMTMKNEGRYKILNTFKEGRGAAFLSFFLFIGCLFINLPAVAGSSQSMGELTLLSVQPRIITPNNDSINDVVYFKFDTALSGLPIESAIFDINGAKVGSMEFSGDDTALTWDGRDDSGHVVSSGIYIYSIKIGKNLATGTLVVAK